MGSKDTESPNSETGYVTVVRKIQYRTSSDSDCTGYNRWFVHMILDEPCASGCSVQIHAVSREFKEMSRQPGHKGPRSKSCVLRRKFHPRNKCPTEVNNSVPPKVPESEKHARYSLAIYIRSVPFVRECRIDRILWFGQDQMFQHVCDERTANTPPATVTVINGHINTWVSAV